jgi:hypothetical protein
MRESTGLADSLDLMTRRLRCETAATDLRLTLATARRGLLETKFDPSQPRVPAGHSDGGQWTGARGAPMSIPKIVSVARQLGIVGGNTEEDWRRCLDLCTPFLERPAGSGSDRNYWDFQKCLNACLGKNI